MYKKLLLFLLIPAGSLLLMVSCQDKKEVVGFQSNYEIQSVDLPELLNTNSARPVLFTARVTHPEGNKGISSVKMVITDSTGSEFTAQELYDDGGAQHPESGDLIAFDQVYSYRVVPSQWDLPVGNYQIKIVATAADNKVLESAAQVLEVLLNQPPELTEFSFPDSIFSDMGPVQVSFTVNDGDGLKDIRWVLIRGLKEGSSAVSFQDTVFNPLNNSPVFTANIDSNFAIGKTGNYQLEFLAQDRFGDKSEVKTHNIFVENPPPVFVGVSVPDTLEIPASGSVIAAFTAKVTDQPSLADIDSVYFDSYLPNGNASSSNPFIMYDDGTVESGDVQAGDGIYTVTIQLPAGTPSGDYLFKFYATDKAGQRTAGPEKTLHAK